ncbi:MAG: hypothetical protein RL318_2916 [Fibrobacterota bacterium]|jgi:D-lactate dehydrogenase
MKIAMFSTKAWVQQAFEPLAERFGAEITWLEPKLGLETVSLAAGHEVVCAFVNDKLDAPVMERLAALGVKCVAMRCAGFNNVDLKAAARLEIPVVRVPAYSPYAVAEHALGLMLCLNRRYHRSWARVKEGNFSLDGLLGFDMRGKTIGIIGTGKIGQVLATMLQGFGCKLLAYDKFPSQAMKDAGIEYVELQRLYEESDIISLHCPLTQETFHMINRFSIDTMKKGVMIINTSRGALIDTDAVIDGLKAAKVGYLGLDVYEEEQNLFFEDLSDQVIQDDTFVRLLAFPGVLMSAHQAFFTKEAVDNIAETTMENIRLVLETGECANRVTV